MLFDPFAVVGTDVNVDADNLSFRFARVQFFTSFGRVAKVQHSKERCRQYQRTSMCNSGFDYDIRTSGPDQFLYGNDVLRKLDDWPTEPIKIVNIPTLHAFA